MRIILCDRKNFKQLKVKNGIKYIFLKIRLDTLGNPAQNLK